MPDVPAGLRVLSALLLVATPVIFAIVNMLHLKKP